jgi:hypothetical protein
MFTNDAVPGLADGSITVTFRNWKRPQAKAGGRFHKGDLWFEVDAVTVVPVSSISRADARRAGEADVAGVLRRLGEPDPDLLVHRVSFHRIPPAGPPANEADLTPDDVVELDRRLDRLDAAAEDGPWTRPTLRIIDAQPGVVSTLLAEQLERERAALKADVRKLKRLGLTLSLDVGYELSPRGQAYLDAVERPREPGRSARRAARSEGPYPSDAGS